MNRFPSFAALLALLVLGTGLPSALGQLTVYTIYGQVQQPDGKPAGRVAVEITSSSGYARQVMTNDQGQYEVPGLAGGRYRLTATHPDDPTLVSDPVETDISRAPVPRVMVHLFLRSSADAPGKSKEGSVVSVPEMAQTAPKDAQKAYEKALEQKVKGDLTRASEEVAKALVLFPEYFQAMTLRGELLIRQGKTAEALADFSNALKINPDFGPALRGAGFCKLQQRKVAEAALDLERALRLNPLDSDAHLYYGIATLALDRKIEARQSLEQALHLAPDGAVSAHVYLANLEAAEGRFRAAADQLAAYLVLRPDAPNAGKLKLQETEWRQRGGQ